jgi:hypothetical protein
LIMVAHILNLIAAPIRGRKTCRPRVRRAVGIWNFPQFIGFLSSQKPSRPNDWLSG